MGLYDYMFGDQEEVDAAPKPETMYGFTSEGLDQEAQKYAELVQIPETTWKDVGNVALDFTPIIGDIKGGYETVQMIGDELDKEDPNWYLIGAMGGLGAAATIIGLVPGAGDAAAKAIMAGARSMADGAGKVADALPKYDPNTLGSMGGNMFSGSTPAVKQTEEVFGSNQGPALEPNLPPEIGPNRRVDTRLPAAVSKDDTLQTGAMVSDGDALMSGNKNMGDNFAMMAENYPGLKNLWSEDVAETGANYTNRMKDNIISLYDMSDKLGIAEDSAKWYQGANRIANGLSDRFGIGPEKASGVLAVMSPQKDWFQNVALGERLIKHHTELGPNAPWTQAMDDITTTVPVSRKKQGNTSFQDKKNGLVLDRIKGKNWGELETPMEKAMWLRAYDEAHFGKAHREISPEGDILGYSLNNSGAQTPLVHQGFGAIAKAVRILEGDGTLAAISPELGGNHKVRNFFNNIFTPDSPYDVTVDTHQIAAGLMRPLGSGAVEVQHGLNGANIKGNPARWSNDGKADSGMAGNYGLYFDATTEAAQLRGVLPREMQSISWEQLRTLFPQTLKNNKQFVASTEAIWRMVDDKQLTADGARNMIIAEAEKLGAGGAPSWKSYVGNRRDIGIATAGLVGAAGIATADEANMEEDGFASIPR
tara:strand:- start:355 stop:2301 length:1947 start_codon:yes stop_codon:yes gene_type:complete